MTIQARESNQTPSSRRCAVEFLAQALDRTCRGGRVEPLQGVLRGREAAGPGEGGVDVRSVVDGFVDVGEVDVDKPRACRISVTTAGSPSENGRKLDVLRPPPRLPRDRGSATAHSLRSWACQTIITSRPPGRSACRMLANAATGSAKNMVPNLLIATIEAVRRKAMDLGVGTLEGDVAESLGPGELAGALESRARRRRRRARSLAGPHVPPVGSSARLPQPMSRTLWWG